MKRFSSPGRDASPGDGAKPALLFLLIFILLAEGIVTVGYLSFKSHERQYISEAEEQLAAITELKAAELAKWRKERMADGLVFFKNPSFSALARRFLEKPEDADAQRQLLDWLSTFPKHHGYNRISLLDTQGVNRLSVPAGLPPISSFLVPVVSEVLRTGQVTFQDFYRNEYDHRVYLAVLVPIFDEADGNRPLGVILLRTDPTTYLYPLISRWPVPSTTAETLIVRREGNEVVFLNELRFQTNTALNLRAPVSRVELPAAQAVQGKRGVMRGIDYRGVPVIADLQPIPDSPWFLVARRDFSEVIAESRARLWQTIAMIGSLLFCAAAGVGLIWRHQRVGFYREKANAAETLRESEHKLKLAQEVARLGNYELDVRAGDWTSSEMLDNLFGIDASYPRNIANWSQLIHPDDRKDTLAYFLNHVVMGKQPFDREYRIVRQKDKAVRWMHGLGKLRLDASGDVIAMFGVIQDVTERRLAENALHREQDFQRTLLDHIAEGVVACDAKGELTLFNRVAREWHGMDALSLPPEEWGRHYNLYGSDGTTPLPTEAIPLLRAFRGEIVRNAEITIIAKGQPPRAILASGCPFFDAEHNLLGAVAVMHDITGRKMAEEIILRERDFSQAVLNSLPGLFYLFDEQGRFLRWNKHFEEVSGYSADEIFQMRPLNFFGKTDGQNIADAIQRVSQTGEASVEAGFLSKNKTTTPYFFTGKRFLFDRKPCVVGMGVDITQRKQAEDLLKLSEERYRFALETTGQIGWSTPPDGVVEDMPMWRQYSGQSLEEVKGWKWLAAVHPDDRESARKAWSNAADQKCYYATEYRIRRADGVYRNFMVRGIPLLNEDGSCKEWVGTCIDITDRKLAEDRLIATMKDLRTSNQDLEQFAYVASHDLQEPLRMVANYMQLLERRYKDKLDQNARDFIGFAVSGAVRMQQLIDSLLEYSRVQSRKKPFGEVNLGALLKQVLRDLEKPVLAAGARITADPLPHVFGDALQLGTVFQNLIGNALKFRGKNSPEIHIVADEFSRYWKITVRDNGIGIAPEYQERVFKIFQRLHNQTEYPGTGIGLAVCRRVIERHGGETGVESEFGKGSSFWFTLPKKGEE